MKKRSNLMKAAAFAAAVALTAGMPLSVSQSVFQLSAITASAEDEYTECSDGTLNYLKYSDHITISGCNMEATSVEIPSTIDGLPVTEIGDSAFQIVSLKSVKIPDSVTKIGNWAFSMCFDLTEVTIPDSVQSIGIRAFEMCSSLNTVNFPDHMVELDSLVFDSTPWIEAQRKKDPLVVINGDLIDAQACKGAVEIPSTVKYVSPSAFARNENVTSVVFPTTVSLLNDSTFFYCTSLTSVELPNITSIDGMAFAGCDKLTDVKLSGKLKYINSRAFADINNTGTITFYGSKDTWDKVEKPEDDPYLTNSKYVFDESHVIDDEVAGDVNMDGKFDVADVILLQKWILASPGTELKNWKAGDMCEDGVLDVFDLCMMKTALVSK